MKIFFRYCFSGTLEAPAGRRFWYEVAEEELHGRTWDGHEAKIDRHDVTTHPGFCQKG
jgi:hypothetical protein